MELQIVLRNTLYVTLTFLLHVDFGLVLDPPTFVPQDKKSFRDTSTSMGYYRQMVIDQDNHYVYVGAMERLYRLNADDITRSHLRSDIATAFDPDIQNCEIRGKDKNGYGCKNHIRTIVVNEDKIYSCGTGSFSPVEYEFSKTDLKLLKQPKSRSGQGQCPLDPDDTFACVYVRDGNPGNISALYTGTFRDINKDDPLIHREQLQKNNIKYSDLLRTARSGWLEAGATFVSGFETQNFVYFFFRETAEEFRNDDETLVSRVARICKNDKGTATVLKNKWTTFLKARLNCSIPGSKPFYFNEIRDVKKLGDNRFVGVFTTDNNGLYGSAVCTFTLTETDRVFNGPFWSTSSENNVPTPHPGTCIHNSQDLNTAAQHFIERHPFMSEAVAHENNEPLFYEADVIFTHMVVDRINTKQEYTVYFLATDKGRIYKVAEYEQEGKQKSKVVAVWKPFGNKAEVRIWSMSLFNSYLYIGTDDQVVQVRVTQCDSYTLCTSCVQDPYCGWNRASDSCEMYARGFPQGLQDPSIEVCNDVGSCFRGWETLKVRVSGDPVYLKCDTVCEPKMPVQWWYRNKPILQQDRKYIFTEDFGMVILNTTKADEGSYMCVSDGKYWLAAYEVRLPDCTDPDCMWQEEFRNWCNEFDRYRKEFNNWLCVKQECFSNNNCQANNIPQCEAP